MVVALYSGVKNRYNDNVSLRGLLKSCDVIEVLEKLYSGKPFPSYFKLNEKMRDLRNYIENTNLAEDWKKELKAIKSIYCLNIHDEHKVYIGSAYNDNGCLLKWWKDYFDTLHGRNTELKESFRTHNGDDDYFLNNFFFSILEIFPNTISDKYVIERERHWIFVFNYRVLRCGYNRN